MQNGLSSYRAISLSLVLGLALTGLALMVPCNLHAASNEQTITFSGQKISSVFEGLGDADFEQRLLCRNQIRLGIGD
jgi:hypothetical protein